MAWASLAFTRDVGRIAAVWPANAVVLAILLRQPAGSSLWRRGAYGIAGLLGWFGANLLAADPPGMAVELAMCNGAEVLVAAVLLHRFRAQALDFARPRQLASFLAAATLGPAASAIVAALLLDPSEPADFWTVALNWFTPDALGLLIVTPALMALRRDGLTGLAGALRRGRGLSLAVLAAALAVVFGQQNYPVLFLMPPALVLVAFELGVGGAALALLCCASAAVFLTLTGHGPAMLVHSGGIARLGVLQLFLATLSLTVLPVAAALAKRDQLAAASRLQVARTEAARQEAFEAVRISTLAQQIAGVGHWRRDLRSGRSHWSDHMFVLHGLDPARFDPAQSEAVQFYHPDDQPLIRQTVARAAQTGEPFDLRVRLLRVDDGQERTVAFKGEAERGNHGRVVALVGVMRDITEEETARARIEASEARFRLLAESATDVVMQVDAEDRILFMSPSIRRYGYDPADMVGRRGAEFIHPDDVANILDRVARIAAGEKIDPKADRAYRMMRADGGHAWMEGNSAVVRDADGRRIGLISHLRDVSDRLAVSAALEASEARYRQLADASSDVVIKFNRGNVIQYVSPSCRRYGYEPDDLVGLSGFDLLHPDDLPKLQGIVAELFATGEVDPASDRTYRMRRADGAWIWMEGAPSLIRDEAGETIAFVSQLRDVSERKAATDALAESELRYRVIAENATDIISRTGVRGELLYLSPAVQDVIGRPASELTGRNLLDFLHPDDLAPTLEAYRQIALGERAEDDPVVYRAQHRDGHWISLECNPTPVRDANGRILEFIDVTRDISARVQLEENLRAARDAAEAAAATKSDFMANMSHEIRTPLTAILGFTGLLSSDRTISPDSSGHVRRIASAAQALLAIVNDILDFSKLEAGQVQIKRSPACPGEVLSEAMMLFAPQAEEKGLKLAVSGVDALPDALALDKDRLRQVLLNLIGNAVKFTDRGEVRLAADYDPAAGRLNLRVEDTGAGMNKAQSARLFQRFSQVDASSTRRHGGTGLGLAICKGLVEAMGGEIGVRSRPGHGSVFHVSLPADKAQLATPTNGGEAIVDLAGVRLLVADDNPVNRELVRAIVLPLDVELTEAADGPAALEAAMSLPFDLILMDVRMPGLDGPEVAARIRREPGPNMDVPMLAFTADIDLERHSQAGDFDGAVGKPVLPAQLIKALCAHLAWQVDAAAGETGGRDVARS